MTLARKKLIEPILRAAYPRTRFRVRVGLTVFREECIAVSWKNGPTERMVKKLIGAPGPKKDITLFRYVKPTHLQLVKQGGGI